MAPRRARGPAGGLTLLGRPAGLPASPDAATLERVPNPHRRERYVVRFAAPEFTSKIFTRKVEVLAADGTMIAEVKGAVNEVEVGAGGTVEWFIVPVQIGKNIPVECALEGHKEAGMVGTFTIN